MLPAQFVVPGLPEAPATAQAALGFVAAEPAGRLSRHPGEQLADGPRARAYRPVALAPFAFPSDVFDGPDDGKLRAYWEGVQNGVTPVPVPPVRPLPQTPYWELTRKNPWATDTQAAAAVVRERLAQAALFFKGQEHPDAPADDFLHALRGDYPAGDWPACAQRLDMAAQWMDDAAIFTIHGWSSRMLRQHAFDSASLFQQSRVEDSDALRLAAVQDYWRQWFYALPAGQLGALKAVGHSPDDLLQNLKALWQASERAPTAPLSATPDPHTLILQPDDWLHSKEP